MENENNVTYLHAYKFGEQKKNAVHTLKCNSIVKDTLLQRASTRQTCGT